MPRKNKRKKKKNNSIASSLVASMKNGTLGNDDLFANIQKQINVQVTEEEEAREEDKNKEQTAVKVGEIDDNNNNNNNNNNKLVITSSDDNNDNKKPIIHTPQGKEDHNNNNNNNINNNNNNVIIDGKNAKEVNNNNNNIMSEDFRTYQQQVGLLKIDIDTNHTEMKSSNSYINNKSNYESSIDIDESNIILKNDEKERVKNRIRQKLIQRSKILDRDISFKLQHNIGELLGNYDLISLEVQKHLESENEQSLYAYCNYDMSDEYVRKYTYKQEQIQKQKEDKKKRKKNEDINKKNIQQHHMTDVNYFKNKKNNNNNRKKKEEINITNILNKQNKQRLYASRQRLNELELKLEMREAAERQVRKAQLARFLARRTGSKLK